MLKDYVKQLQKELELPEPAAGAEEDASFSLALEDSVISIIDESPGFKLYADLGYLPEQQLEDFLTIMLRGNLFGQATHFAALGLDESGKKVILQYLFENKPSYRDFHDAVEDFVNTVDFWNDQIKSHPSPEG